MTAKILEFKHKEVKQGTAKADSAPKILTTREIFQNVTDAVLIDWQSAATKNRLNEYITSKIPPRFAAHNGADYVNDLNSIATVEQKIDLPIAIFFPGATPSNQYGWLVAFHREKEMFTTPADMASEATARALNIVLFLSFELELRSLGWK